MLASRLILALLAVAVGGCVTRPAFQDLVIGNESGQEVTLRVVDYRGGTEVWLRLPDGHKTIVSSYPTETGTAVVVVVDPVACRVLSPFDGNMPISNGDPAIGVRVWDNLAAYSTNVNNVAALPLSTDTRIASPCPSVEPRAEAPSNG